MNDSETSGAGGSLDEVLSCLREEKSVARFAELLFGTSDVANLDEFPPNVLADIARRAFAFHGERQAGKAKIGVETFDIDGGRRRSLVMVANDDMPFLLDSLLGELNATGIGAYLIVHPTFKVERDHDGRRESIEGAGDSNWGDGSQESLIVALIDHVGEGEVEGFIQAIDGVMGAVRFAVVDWRQMMARLEQAVADFNQHPPAVAPGVISETVAFCNWLLAGQFTFLGMREYELRGDTRTGELVPASSGGLGVLRDETVRALSRGGEELALTPEIRKFMFGPQPLIITKSSVLSKVHRRAHMDYVGLKLYGSDGAQRGELRIVGLFTSNAYTDRPEKIPFLRQRVEAVLRRTGHAPGSHDGKALLNVLENFPRDELFRIGIEQLLEWSRGILDLELRPRVRVFARRDRFDRFVSVFVYVPRDRFTSLLREQTGQLLSREMGGHVSAYTPFFPEGNLVRVHYIIGRGGAAARPDLDVADLERQITELSLNWSDRLTGSMEKAGGDMAGLGFKYAKAFDPGYSELFPVERALDDVRRIERLSEAQPAAIDFEPDEGHEERIRATVYRFDQPIPLSERVPVLENFGFSSIYERSFEVRPLIEGTPRVVALHDMALAPMDGLEAGDVLAHEELLEEAFLAVRYGEADNDPFNRLVAAVAADWREVAMLRAYGAYLRQLGTPFGMRYVAETLARYHAATRDLVELFKVRLDPDLDLDAAARRQRADEINHAIDEKLADVPSLDEDRIIRHMRNLIDATLRTNFFQNADGRPPETISFKFSSRDVDAMPEPKPYREIWVYSPRVEGVHLRFGPIARGGLRWSDRAQDFRTEVLGLAKAQQVKNTVIIPEGSKGGFLPKRLPRDGGREAMMEEGVAAYRIFISAMLDLTDKIVDGAVQGPERVVRYDGDDPYLVVAADKGTATFSDFANEISEAKGHWLGDAFASGGSAGYDHKKMGITARGAWECVKRHFREMDVDIQSEPFTAVGVGDMSGDVFGNGMLLSEQTRLIAAFDHRDIFIDPDPDAATSFKERRRLFEMARSSWQDYDASLISAGGGVFSRSAKSVTVTPEMAAALGITAGTVTPNELMRAILGASVDLLWFGGIGTYIRASSESNEDADDRANDAIRLTGAQVCAKVIGEGANLGITQAGRIEFALLGGRLNTDFIDNSAGVNSSDMEVNIKIALGQAEASGRIDREERNRILEGMTNDVAQACLENNYDQSLAISLTERESAAEAGFLARLTEYLEAETALDPELEGLPALPEVSRRQAEGRGYTRPEIAVLLSWAKIALSQRLMQRDVADDPACEALLFDYFPEPMREPFGDEIRSHQLRREIIVNRITNDMINEVGPTMAVRLSDAHGGGNNDAAYAYLAVREIYNYPALLGAVHALDGQGDGAVQLELYARIRELMFEQIARLIRFGRDGGLAGMVERYRGAVSAIEGQLDDVMAQTQKELVAGIASDLVSIGAPAEIAQRISQCYVLTVAPTAKVIAEDSGQDIGAAAKALYRCLSFFRVGELVKRTRTLGATDYYDLLVIQSALEALEDAAAGLAREVLAAGEAATGDLGDWIRGNYPGVVRAKATIDQIADGGELTVSRLSVAAQQVRDVARQVR